MDTNLFLVAFMTSTELNTSTVLWFYFRVLPWNILAIYFSDTSSLTIYSFSGGLHHNYSLFWWFVPYFIKFL